MRAVLTIGLAAALVVAGLTACEDGDGADDGRPLVVATTSVLGDVVAQVVGDQGRLEVVMPRGADPHDFSPSPRQAQAMEQADLLVHHGHGVEGGLADVLDSVLDDGTTAWALADHVGPLLPLHEDDAGHGDGDDHAEDHGDEDPHVWTDPRRMAAAVRALGDAVAALPGLDPDVVRANAARYAADLDALDAEVAAAVAVLPSTRRVLVTDHLVLGYFADRYGFEVVGTLVRSASTGAQPTAAELEDLADTMVRRRVPVVFTEVGGSTRLADSVARLGTGIRVVELYAEALGPAGSPAGTYVGMVRTNVARIVGALR